MGAAERLRCASDVGADGGDGDAVAADDCVAPGGDDAVVDDDADDAYATGDRH